MREGKKKRKEKKGKEKKREGKTDKLFVITVAQLIYIVIILLLMDKGKRPL